MKKLLKVVLLGVTTFVTANFIVQMNNLNTRMKKNVERETERKIRSMETYKEK